MVLKIDPHFLYNFFRIEAILLTSLLLGKLIALSGLERRDRKLALPIVEAHSVAAELDPFFRASAPALILLW